MSHKSQHRSDLAHSHLDALIGTLHRPRNWLVLLLFVYLGVASWHVYKPMPHGLNARFELKPAHEVEFLVDASWITSDGDQAQTTQIFERMLELIDQSERLIVLEMFLLNDFAGEADGAHRPLSSLVVNALIKQKQKHPGMPVVLITDPFNRLYGGAESALLESASSAGIEVIETQLTKLPDSNPAWSGIWRLCCQFLGNSTSGWLPNPVGGDQVTLRTYLRLLNFKANHRKALVVDQGSTLTGLVTTANAHDASSRHSNVGLVFSGPAAGDLLSTMAATARFSGSDLSMPTSYSSTDTSSTMATILTESAIRDQILEILNTARAGDRLDLALFYLSHRDIITAITRAQQRGVALRLLMDPNEDAFGRKKNGIPNRQVALELHQFGVPIRWCNTRGEQCHYKHLMHITPSGEASLLIGSANYTRRNLDGFNLETQALIEADASEKVMVDAALFFDQRWNNLNDQLHSKDYAAFEDQSQFRYWRYRFMEATGLSTF